MVALRKSSHVDHVRYAACLSTVGIISTGATNVTIRSKALEEVNSFCIGFCISFSANTENPNIFSALKLGYCIDVIQPIVSMSVDVSHVHKFTYILFQILFNIILS